MSGNDRDADGVASDPGASDLRESLDALARLEVAGLGLTDVLTRVAHLAVHAIPGAVGGGLTLHEEGRQNTLVATAQFVTDVDEVQYSLDEGPCITAAAEARTVRSGSLGGEQRWPRFGPRVGRMGVHSVLSLPLLIPGGVVGAMNIYAHEKNAFDERAEELGELFAIPAAISVSSARALAQAHRLAAQLEAALATRATIDQACGVLMSRSGGTADQAFERLKEISQSEHTKLAVVAQSIVDDAVRRARARHARRRESE